MGHRHRSSTSQIFEDEQDQAWNHTHTEQPYMNMAMFSSAENCPLYYPAENVPVDNIHSSSNWNSATRLNGYSSFSHSGDTSHYGSNSSGPYYDPFLHASDAASLCMVANNDTSNAASSGHVRQSYHYPDGGFVDLTTANGVPQKRKSPGIPIAYERGNTNRLYSAGSSSNHPISSEMPTDKHNANHHSIPWHHVNPDPNYTGSGISIRGEDSRNVRSRSATTLEPNPARSLSMSNPSQNSLSSSHHNNHPNSLDFPGPSSSTMILGLERTNINPAQGRILTSDLSSFSQGTNLLTRSSGTSASVEVGEYQHGFVPGRNPIVPQGFNGSLMHSVRGACSSNSHRRSPSFRASSSNFHLGHGAPSDDGLQLVAESYSSRHPRPLSTVGWHSNDRNGRPRLFNDRYRSEPNGVAFHDRLTSEGLMIVDRSAFYGARNVLDQHRDMRLDIDHMSYEELLALGERIGSVNTGLPENMISSCLTESKCCSSDQMTDEGSCAICLEEYKNMDDVGTLKSCGHDYHVSCIKKWLAMKNMCPICKGAALPDDMKQK